jgi:hypothetical protein
LAIAFSTKNLNVHELYDLVCPFPSDINAVLLALTTPGIRSWDPPRFTGPMKANRNSSGQSFHDVLANKCFLLLAMDIALHVVGGVAHQL